MNTTCIINQHKISKTTQKKMEFILADENQSITGFVNVYQLSAHPPNAWLADI